MGGRTGFSRFEKRRGDVFVPFALVVSDGLHPMPDSLKIDDLTGSGEFESNLSLKGDALCPFIVSCGSDTVGICGKARATWVGGC